MDFVDILQKYGVPYHASGRGTRPGWLNLACVRCGKDPYMGYNIAGRYCTSWCCSYIPMMEVLLALTGLSGQECYKLLGDIPREHLSNTLKSGGRLKLPEGIGRPGELHCEYLVSRGFDLQQIVSTWHVGGIGMDGGSLKWRLYIPVHLRGEVVTWTTRAIGSKQPRYWSAARKESTVQIENCLYGIDHVRNAVCVVEGPTDVWSIGPGAVALCGLRVSPAQLQQLSRIPKRIICFDNEPEAQKRARTLLADLSVFEGQTENCILETGKDAASASKSEVLLLQNKLRG